MNRLLCTLLLTAFASASATTLTLTPGQTASVDGAKITLLRVTDSRCLPHAYCIMAGNVTASVMVSKLGTIRTLKVTLPGGAVNTPAGILRLQGATRMEKGQRQRLTLALQAK